MAANVGALDDIHGRQGQRDTVYDFRKLN